jgi:hypothetical protein
MKRLITIIFQCLIRELRLRSFDFIEGRAARGYLRDENEEGKFSRDHTRIVFGAQFPVDAAR